MSVPNGIGYVETPAPRRAAVPFHQAVEGVLSAMRAEADIEVSFRSVLSGDDLAGERCPGGETVEVRLSSGGALIGLVCGRPLPAQPPLDAAGVALVRAVARLIADEADRRAPELRDQVAAVRRVRGLLRGGGATLAFSPIVRLDAYSDAAPVAWEAVPAERGRVPRPTRRWLDEAERFGLRSALELAGARTAIQQLDSFPPKSGMVLPMSGPSVVARAFRALLADVPPGRLVLELSERALIHDYDRLERALGELRERGIGLAIDDAGAGVASMAHVVRLHPDYIKLDDALTKGIASDLRLRDLVSSVVAFAGAVGARVVAESVAQRREAAALAHLGVMYGQGPLFAQIHAR